jgi:4-amino-4-deoxy-L-arabinose transferase-like glycosyltransferase
MLQAFVLLPSLVIAYAIAAPASWRKKIIDLVVAFAAMVVSFGWYIAIVELVPASWRPYIGGSQNNSILELTFGYNGLGRLSGNETGSVGSFGAVGSDGVWDAPGWTRMFLSESGEMASFLIPAALILAVAAFVIIGRKAYVNALRKHETTGETLALGALALYGSWLVVNVLVFSFMAGIYHDYYTVALAPAIAGTVAIGGTILWAKRSSLVARAGLALAALTTALWSLEMATIAGGVYLIVAIAAAIALFVAASVLLPERLFPQVVSKIGLGVAIASSLAVPASYSIQTVLTPHAGSTVTAGPVWTGMRDPGSWDTRPNQFPQGDTASLVRGRNVSGEMIALLSTRANSYTWVAATIGGQNSASYQLATGYSVMAVGGFNGSDPSPTLDAFKALVAQGKIHYYISSGTMGGQSGGSNVSSEIASWVSSTFTAQTVGSVTVYDLTQATS